MKICVTFLKSFKKLALRVLSGLKTTRVFRVVFKPDKTLLLVFKIVRKHRQLLNCFVLQILSYLK